MSNIKSLITGGAGFIGSHLVEKLLQENHEILIVDNLCTGKKSNINEIDKIEFLEKEVGDGDTLSRILEFNPDYCFHLAAQSSVIVSVEDPLLDKDYNITQPLKLIELIKKTDCKRFFFSSSGGTIYGEPKIIPTKESDFGSEPASPYGIAKKKLNEHIVNILKESDVKYSILNLANVYGPRQDPHGEAGVISIFSNRILNGKSPIVYGTGEQTRDFVYVGDVISALQKCMSSKENHILNIGSAIETSVLDLISIIDSVVGTKSEILFEQKREGELPRSALDCSLAKEKIDWEAKIPLEDGISAVINWVKN